MRSREFVLEVTVTVDPDEVDTPEQKAVEKEREIRRTIEGIDPSVGIFKVTGSLLS